jgi:RNA 2',3'-cyclic 3'-phosphodiesterase
MTPTELPSTRRLFVGLMADPAVREAVMDWRARWQWPRGTALSSPAHLHLTLHFLGETDEALLGPLRAALAGVDMPALRLRLGSPETWGRGLVVLRPDPDAALDALHHGVQQALASVGLLQPAQLGLPWKPHLTLARKATGAQPPPDRLDLQWHVGAFSLVWSRLPPRVPRARYEEVGRWGRGSEALDTGARRTT